MTRCFRESLAIAGASDDEIAYVNAHGPGTAACDAAEAKIMDELLPQAHGIYSIKPLVGHCQSAAAGVETLATLYAYQTGYIPAPPQVAPGHPKLIDGRTRAVPGMTLKSSIGMGGYNTAVVIAEPDDR
jgi:3-oxoacyl-[acyl-carrier-protein] synthase II